MRKFLLILGIIFLGCTSVFAAKIPEDVKNYVYQQIPNADIRFDGVIIFPSNTVYLPLYPSLFSDIKTLEIKQTFPEVKSLTQEPDIVIFNNDFVLLKVLSDGQGHKTVAHLTNPPLQVRTGLLPQDMLVPSGLIIPENIKGIIGNLKIDTKNEDIIRVENKDSFEEFLAKDNPNTTQAIIPFLKNKTIFVTTNYSKNIQILEPGNSAPSYSLAQHSVPIDALAVNNGKFLLVTSCDRPFVDVVSVADSRFIKQIELGANPEQMIMDRASDKVYVVSPSASTVFVIDIKTMSLVQKIKVNGYCEHMILASDKLFYADKLNNEIWAIELNNEYILKDIGKFPNVSALAFADNKLFISSRTKSRIAVIDYNTLGLVSEFTTVNKPLAMLVNDHTLFVLGSQNNEIQLINTENNKITGKVDLGTGGFSTGLKRIDDTNYATINDLKNNYFSIFDLSSAKLVKTYSLNIPLKDVIIANKVRLFK